MQCSAWFFAQWFTRCASRLGLERMTFTPLWEIMKTKLPSLLRQLYKTTSSFSGYGRPEFSQFSKARFPSILTPPIYVLRPLSLPGIWQLSQVLFYLGRQTNVWSTLNHLAATSQHSIRIYKLAKAFAFDKSVCKPLSSSSCKRQANAFKRLKESLEIAHAPSHPNSGGSIKRFCALPWPSLAKAQQVQ